MRSHLPKLSTMLYCLITFVQIASVSLTTPTLPTLRGAYRQRSRPDGAASLLFFRAILLYLRSATPFASRIHLFCCSARHLAQQTSISFPLSGGAEVHDAEVDCLFPVAHRAVASIRNLATGKVPVLNLYVLRIYAARPPRDVDSIGAILRRNGG